LSRIPRISKTLFRNSACWTCRRRLDRLTRWSGPYQRFAI